MTRLLAGIRVLESAQLFNGDRLGGLLADLGADVIKVESPGRGDYLRDFLGQMTPHHSPAHVEVNKNKRSITLNLRTDAGRDVFWRLLETADVIVDGNVAGTMDALGVGYEAVRARKPGIVFCHYSGFGAAGPYAVIPTHGQMMNALVAGTPMAKDEEGFLHPRIPSDRMGSTANGGEGTATGAAYAALHVASALVARARTGEGCFIDAAGADGVAANSWVALTYALNDHRITDRSTMPARAEGENVGAKYQFYETRDGKVLLFCCIEPKFWRSFCEAIERADLIGDEGSAPVEWADDVELRRALQGIFHERDLSDWVALAAKHDIAMGPAYQEMAELPRDEHLRTRGLFVDGVDPDGAPYTYIGLPALVNGDQFEVRRPAPDLGQHTDEVLAEIGCSSQDIERLHDERIV
jgi:crotonobetainyl-CoA:carnitine CoA-transferase CaiB-like acyl-CoA transferase